MCIYSYIQLYNFYYIIHNSISTQFVIIEQINQAYTKIPICITLSTMHQIHISHLKSCLTYLHCLCFHAISCKKVICRLIEQNICRNVKCFIYHEMLKEIYGYDEVMGEEGLPCQSYYYTLYPTRGLGAAPWAMLFIPYQHHSVYSVLQTHAPSDCGRSLDVKASPSFSDFLLSSDFLALHHSVTPSFLIQDLEDCYNPRYKQAKQFNVLHYLFIFCVPDGNLLKSVFSFHYMNPGN